MGGYIGLASSNSRFPVEWSVCGAVPAPVEGGDGAGGEVEPVGVAGRGAGDRVQVLSGDRFWCGGVRDVAERGEGHCVAASVVEGLGGDPPAGADHSKEVVVPAACCGTLPEGFRGVPQIGEVLTGDVEVLARNLLDQVRSDVHEAQDDTLRVDLPETRTVISCMRMRSSGE